MIKIMAAENLEEYGSSIWVEMETVKATVVAYAKDEISLGKLEPKVRDSVKRDANTELSDVGQAPVPHQYTQLQVAEFLGWTRAKADKLRPDFKCEVAFKALDAVNAGVIELKHLKGLGRDEASTAKWIPSWPKGHQRKLPGSRGPPAKGD